MNNAERMKGRIEIAQDVITKLQAEEIIARTGDYLAGLIPAHKGELRDVLVKNNPKCTACALGSMFLCVVRKHDDFDLDTKSMIVRSLRGDVRHIDEDDMRAKISPWFTEDESDVIETIFEGELEAMSDRDRLIFIMRYIIDHKAGALIEEDIIDAGKALIEKQGLRV